jgi:folate-binding protein YgfZ
MKHLLEHRGLLHLTGDDVRSFLQGLLTNDIHKLTPEKSLYAALLTPQGKFLYDFFVYDWQGGVLLEYYKPMAADILKKLTLYRLRSKITFTDVSDQYMTIAAWGDEQPNLKDPRHEKMGMRYITAEKLSDNLVPASEYHAHRIALTIPEMPDDLISGDSFPLLSNMEELHAIDYQKGCYVGQEVTARSKYRGNLRKKIWTVKIEGDAPAPGTPIRIGQRVVGTMLSHANDLGLAQIENEVAAQKLQAEKATLTIL